MYSSYADTRGAGAVGVRVCQSQSLDQSVLSIESVKDDRYMGARNGGREWVSSGGTPHQILGGLCM